jgi:hypothetical protein
MNSILAFVLTVFIIQVGMIAVHVVLATIVSLHIIATTGKMWMSHDELGEEIKQRSLGRFILTTYPVVFWWLLLWERIAGDSHE